jgi:midasin
LAIGTKAFSLLSGNALVDSFQQYLQAELNPGFQLKTGLSMEILWKELRPLTIPDLQTIKTLREMEKLATRFDALKWDVSISVSELGAIMNSLVKAYRLVLTSKVDTRSL